MNTQTLISEIRDMFLNDEIDANETMDLLNTLLGAVIYRGRYRDICKIYQDDIEGLNHSVRELYPNALEPSTSSYMHKILLLFFA
jgi:spore germination protein YaaH